ncbi:MAG: hypothetical protein Q9M92_17855 [Enterobacterales bacterium]|nr:hypothetical protein [Enterobacterales bacterium]
MINKNIFSLLLVIISYGVSSIVMAGDDASGNIPRQVDLSLTHKNYQLTEADRVWVATLVKNFNYQGKIMLFVQTDLPLESNACSLSGKVYQNLNDETLYYVAEGDVMLKIGEKHPFSRGVGGFSMHAPKSKHFIACLNCLSGGVLVRNSSEVTKGSVTWYGRDWNRLESKNTE